MSLEPDQVSIQIYELYFLQPGTFKILYTMSINEKSNSENEDFRLFTGLSRHPVKLLPGLTVRIVIFSIIWWGLSAGVMDQIILMLFLILASALISILLIPPQKVNITGMILFIPFFIRLSVMGGIDVAFRAFRPSMPLKTGFVKYPLSLSHQTARVLFVWVVSLLPGTASVCLKDNVMNIHVLDRNISHTSNLEKLEHKIALIFG